MLYIPYPFKRCVMCGNTHPATTEFFQLDRSKADGLRNFCKPCGHARYRVQYERAKLERAAPPGYKRCRACGSTKPETDEFYYRTSKRDGGFRSHCKACTDQENKAWKEQNAERYTEQSHEYGRRRYWNNRDEERAKYKEWREANLEYNRKRVRDYYHANKDKERERHRRWRKQALAQRAAYMRQWHRKHPERGKEKREKLKREHPERYRAYYKQGEARRRARERAADGCFTTQDILTQYKHQRGKCYYCGKKVGKVYHVDHVVPLSRGGSNGPENIVIACPTCNMRKASKLPHEWGEGGRLL